MITLEEYYNSLFDAYYMLIDNKGKMIYGKGIVPFQIIKETKKITKKHIRNRKSNIKVEVLWNKKEKTISRITVLGYTKKDKI